MTVLPPTCCASEIQALGSYYLMIGCCLKSVSCSGLALTPPATLWPGPSTASHSTLRYCLPSLKAARFNACLCHIPSLCMSTHVMHACLIRQFGAHKLLCLRCASLIYGLEVIYEPPLLPPPPPVHGLQAHTIG